jgi:hypothetical protein
MRLAAVERRNFKGPYYQLGDIIEDRHELHPGRMLTCRLPRDVRDGTGKKVATMPAIYRMG